jgi:hypothetical protein
LGVAAETTDMFLMGVKRRRGDGATVRREDRARVRVAMRIDIEDDLEIGRRDGQRGEPDASETVHEPTWLRWVGSVV